MQLWYKQSVQMSFASAANLEAQKASVSALECNGSPYPYPVANSDITGSAAITVKPSRHLMAHPAGDLVITSDYSDSSQIHKGAVQMLSLLFASLHAFVPFSSLRHVVPQQQQFSGEAKGEQYTAAAGAMQWSLPHRMARRMQKQRALLQSPRGSSSVIGTNSSSSSSSSSITSIDTSSSSSIGVHSGSKLEPVIIRHIVKLAGPFDQQQTRAIRVLVEVKARG